MSRWLLCLALGLFAMLPAPVLAQAGPQLDPDQPYAPARKVNPVTYDVEFAAIVTAQYHTKTLRVWMPIPPSDAIQEVSGSEFSTFPMQVKPQIGTEEKFGNKFAYFEFDHPEGGQIIKHKFTIKVYEARRDVEPAKVAAVKQWPPGFDKYLKGEAQSVVINDQVKNLAQLWVPKPQGPATDISAVIFGVNGFMKYDHVIA